MAKREAGRISFPREGQRSPSENIIIGGRGTVRDVVKAASRPGGSFRPGGGGGGFSASDRARQSAAERK